MPCTGSNELRLRDFLGQEDRVNVDIVGVGRGAERFVQEPSGDQGDYGSPIYEVGVDVIAGIHLANQP
jgi:hypothetical protein